MKDFYIGSPLPPEDLMFRGPFIANVWEALKTDHVILTSPRRTGKTSVMDFMSFNAQNNFACVSVFVQDLDHPAEFLLTLLDAFHDKYPDYFKDLLDASSKFLKKIVGSVEKVEFASFKVGFRKSNPDFHNEWKLLGDEFFQQVRKKNLKVLFIVDEFPDLIVHMHKKFPELVQPFLAWYRGHCTKPSPKKDPIRWLLGGSVNLASTLDRLNCLDLTNHFNTIDLPVLKNSQVIEFVNIMLADHGARYDLNVPKAVAARLGRPVPLFLQMATQELARSSKRKPDPLTVADVDQVFNDMVRSSVARDKLQHFYTRIDLYYSEPQRSAAYFLLVKLCLSTNGVKKTFLKQAFTKILDDKAEPTTSDQKERMFNQLMRDLENDFYIVEVKEQVYDFASGVLKDWWKKYYG